MNRPPCCPIGHCVCSVHRRHESALSDAGRAVALNPRGAQNFVCQGRSLHDSKMLSEAGAAYLTAMRFGLEGGLVLRPRHAGVRCRPRSELNPSGPAATECTVLPTSISTNYKEFLRVNHGKIRDSMGF